MRFASLSLLVAAMLGFASGARAIQISYSVVDLGSSRYRYEYTITNDSSGPNLRLFDLLFDPALYDEATLANASSPSSAAQWNVLFLAPGIAVPPAFDALATAGGIPAGASASGLAVEFRWLGDGSPGPQDFEVYDPATFERLARGTTTRNAPDADADGVSDASDDCPFYANPTQLDTDQDGRGDDCECTDQNRDGRNTVSDLVAINTAIFNPSLATPLCDGNNDARCSVSDIVAANVEIFSPGNTSTCSRQPVPGP